MGSGIWSNDVYTAAQAYRARIGASAFAYSDRGATAVHPDLDPRGVSVRESRDSAEHPGSTPIAVLFDVTGSMRYVPRTLQTRLPALLDLLLSRGYVEHPQIMFGAVGDATCDRAPLQLGQFESDNRMDADLGRILLEGGGGGGMQESYELAMYFMARHTALDRVEKHGKRGYLFMIGDELAYPYVMTGLVRRVIGDHLDEDIPTGAIVGELTRMYDVYFIIPAGAHNARDDRLLRFWRELLGQNVILLDDPDAVCETIGLAVGLAEGTVSLDEGLEHLRDQRAETTSAVSRALATLDEGGRGPARGHTRGHEGVVRL